QKARSWRVHYCVPCRVSLDTSAPWAAGVGKSADAARRSACATFARQRAHSAFHGISRAEGPFKQATKGDGLSHMQRAKVLGMTSYGSISRRRFLAAAAAAPLALAAPAGKNVPIGLELYSVRDEMTKDTLATVRAIAKM